jgi:hypothetical protein
MKPLPFFIETTGYLRPLQGVQNVIRYECHRVILLQKSAFSFTGP